MTVLLRSLAVLLLLSGCGDPLAESDAAFSYHLVRSNGEEMTIAGRSASWGVTELQTSTGFQRQFHLQLVSEPGAGDNLLSGPVLLVDSRNDDVAQESPSTGTYRLVPTGDQFFVVGIGTASGSYVADGGTVTITRSSESTIQGRLDLHFKTSSLRDDIPTFTLTGEFTAKTPP